MSLVYAMMNDLNFINLGGNKNYLQYINLSIMNSLISLVLTGKAYDLKNTEIHL